MAQIAIVEMIYVAKSGRQYPAQHVEVKVGWELDDLENKAKSDLSLRDYAIQFTNRRGHKQVIMPGDLETIIVNVVAVREEQWEEPAYEELQEKWKADLVFTDPYGETVVAEHKLDDTAPVPPKSDLAKLYRRNPIDNMMAAVTPDGSTTQSIRLTWGAKPTPPQQRVNWGESSSEKTQPMTVIKASERGLSVDEATRIVEAVAAGGTVSAGAH